MGYSLLHLALLMAVLAFMVSAHKECPAGKGVCVESRYCKDGRRTNTGHHKCILANGNHGVCCDGCVTSKGGPGICVAAEQCGTYTRDFLLDRKKFNANQWWKEPSGVCYKKKNTKYYCCPTELQKPMPMLGSSMTYIPESNNAFPTCQTPTNHSGRCVPMYLCDDLHSKFMKSRNMMLEKLLWNSRCPSDASDSTSVCCQNPWNPDDLIRHHKAEKLDLNKCGSIGMKDRILEGSVAGLGQYPWMANLMYYKGRVKVTQCSGSLIHTKYVLTAAHCSKPRFKPISVRLGEYDLSTDKDCVDGVCASPIKEYSIAKWIAHKEYRKRPGKADIALVKLSYPAKITPGEITPICLPLTEQWLMTKPSQLTVTGWGLMENQRLSDILMETNLQLVDRNEDCQEEQLICARGRNLEGHCKGDSGGPLQQIMPYGKNYRMVLFGVVSGGAKECSVDDETMGVSVMVGYHLRWILDNMDI